MRHLFSPEGERALQAVMRLDPVLAFDFDGTLAPIVDRPDEATVPEAVSRCLALLARRLSVAIVSGRSVADVGPRLGFAAHHVIGNHGAEDPQASGRPAMPHPALEILRQRIAEHTPALRAAGVGIEDKGLSISLHYRLAPDAGAALVSIESLLQGIEPALHRLGGKRIVNVVVAGLPDKGDAVTALVERSRAGAAVFVGDDVNDEAVFVRAEAHWLTVRIGREDPHSKAMFFLDSDTELIRMLEKMLALGAPP